MAFPLFLQSFISLQSCTYDVTSIAPFLESYARVMKTIQESQTFTEAFYSRLLQTDEKSTYPGLAGRVFGHDRLQHERTNSKLARTTWNPLFPINHAEAMARDLMGRLRRDSWLTSKKV